MKHLKVTYIPDLDGISLNEAAELMETKALRESIDVVNWKEYPYKPVVAFDIARGAKDLYIHYFVRGMSLRATAGADGEPVHTDSCVEFFMRKQDEEAYVNFEFNCISVCLAGRGKNRHERTPLTPDEYQQIRRYTTVQGKSFPEIKGIHAWELTVAIPFALMGLDATDLPEMIRGNFYKCADLTANPHYVTWNPIDRPAPDYHCPDQFGEIYF